MMNEAQANTRTRDGQTAEKSGASWVRFEFTSLTAESVSVAGTFNKWQANATPLIPLGQGLWAKDLELPPGEHEYCLVVDSQWLPDPDPQATDLRPIALAV